MTVVSLLVLLFFISLHDYTMNKKLDKINEKLDTIIEFKEV